MTEIRSLTKHDDTSSFTCGNENLDMFIRNYAWNNHKSDLTKTYLLTEADRIIGFYSICMSSMQFDTVPIRFRKGVPHHQVPLMLLARLAVHKDYQGKGIGTTLLRDAIQRTIQVADLTGTRGIVVHAKDQDARRWYERRGFDEHPEYPNTMFLFMKDIRMTKELQN